MYPDYNQFINFIYIPLCNWTQTSHKRQDVYFNKAKQINKLRIEYLILEDMFVDKFVLYMSYTRHMAAILQTFLKVEFPTGKNLACVSRDDICES